MARDRIYTVLMAIAILGPMTYVGSHYLKEEPTDEENRKHLIASGITLVFWGVIWALMKKGYLASYAFQLR